jgi:phosphoglycolate phosphatase
MSLRRPHLVLFDLDGTLVDTAADLAAAANRCRATRGLAPLPVSALRPCASHGARGLLRICLDLAPADADYEVARLEFLDHYEQALCVHSRVFAPLDAMLVDLDAAGIRWGIVTNKAARFTVPLVRALHLHERAACVVSGDTTPHAKPHPAPVLHALGATGIAPDLAVFIGDDRRDIAAGRAAGTQTAIAQYGYLDGETALASWGADHTFATAMEMRQWASELR